MSSLPESAQHAGESAVAHALRSYLGYGLCAETSGEVVEALLEALEEAGLVVVRADDLHHYLNREGGANMRREVDAMNRLLAAIQSESNEETNA